MKMRIERHGQQVTGGRYRAVHLGVFADCVITGVTIDSDGPGDYFPISWQDARGNRISVSAKGVDIDAARMAAHLAILRNA